MTKKLPHIIESQQFSTELIDFIFKKADYYRDKKFDTICNGKILASLFYEPSTRTRFSFESAMLRLGGTVISTENAKEFSSASKGETLLDTIRIIERYTDVIVLRHYENEAAKVAASVSTVPIINAGDGKGQHPTQALLDMYTILRECGRLDNLIISMVGDLASGRTVRSLAYLLSKRKNVKINFISPNHLRVGDDIKSYLHKNNVTYVESDDLKTHLSESDVIYMTRIQKERISAEDYEKAKGTFVLDLKNLHMVRNDARIMHPLPHIDEINFPLAVETNDPRVAYFRQAENGLYVRMALLAYLLG